MTESGSALRWASAHSSDTTTGGQTITMYYDQYYPIYGAALNSTGQLALPVAINGTPNLRGGGIGTIALFTPSGP